MAKLDYDLFEKENKSKYVYFAPRGQITFTPNILTTHFALKSEYEAILPKQRMIDADALLEWVKKNKEYHSISEKLYKPEFVFETSVNVDSLNQQINELARHYLYD